MSKKIKLKDVPKGSLFKYKSTIAFKSEYSTDDGRPECFILGSGEFFSCGGINASEMLQLKVIEISYSNFIK